MVALTTIITITVKISKSPTIKSTNSLHINERIVPDLICGDLDSIKSDVLKYYKEKVFRII